VRIRIEAAGVAQEARLADTPCARAIFAALPITARANTWGDEIYFAIPVEEGLDATAAEVVEAGDLGYWPTGRAFCIFFGPTPASTGAEIRPASAVNVVGRLKGEAREFKKVPPGATIAMTRAAD
jgi:hypothetical protein